MNFKKFADKKGLLWLTARHVAILMQCSVEHVYDLVKRGKLCYIRDGKNIRFKPEDLDDYEQQSYVRN